MTEQLAGGKRRQIDVDDDEQLGRTDNHTKKQLLYSDPSAQLPMQLQTEEEEIKSDSATLEIERRTVHNARSSIEEGQTHQHLFEDGSEEALAFTQMFNYLHAAVKHMDIDEDRKLKVRSSAFSVCLVKSLLLIRLDNSKAANGTTPT
ncbi:hypothetical protein PI126_g22849 [Phytophthora idaei]|nr:hypothetical protein PI126_g22849 [Phytophthora idaei]